MSQESPDPAARPVASSDRRVPEAAAPAQPSTPDPIAPGLSDFAGDRIEERAAASSGAVRERSGPRFQWPLTVVLLGLLLSLIVVASDHFRRGSVLFAVVVCMAFLMRLLLREREAGWLAVRSRMVDLACLGFLAVSLSVFSLIVPPPS